MLASRYRNDLYCQWQISVEIGKVCCVVIVNMYLLLIVCFFGFILITRQRYMCTNVTLECVPYVNWSFSLQRVLLHFEQFDVQYDKNCFLDNVTVTDSVTGDQLYTLCGRNLPGDVISSSNQLLIVFVTDSSVTNYGFMIKYTAWTTIPGRLTRRVRSNKCVCAYAVCVFICCLCT